MQPPCPAPHREGGSSRLPRPGPSTEEIPQSRRDGRRSRSWMKAGRCARSRGPAALGPRRDPPGSGLPVLECQWQTMGDVGRHGVSEDLAGRPVGPESPSPPEPGGLERCPSTTRWMPQCTRTGSTSGCASTSICTGSNRPDGASRQLPGSRPAPYGHRRTRRLSWPQDAELRSLISMPTPPTTPRTFTLQLGEKWLAITVATVKSHCPFIASLEVPASDGRFVHDAVIFRLLCFRETSLMVAFG
ncbi:hypothetical protein SAMN06272775_0035 [Streptomyces sp. 2323.1]|nr:hypothetical protein SAMN06272775_0035 [Streptomyces sp. 2323.1]